MGGGAVELAEGDVESQAGVSMGPEDLAGSESVADRGSERDFGNEKSYLVKLTFNTERN